MRRVLILGEPEVSAVTLTNQSEITDYENKATAEAADDYIRRSGVCPPEDGTTPVDALEAIDIDSYSA